MKEPTTLAAYVMTHSRIALLMLLILAPGCALRASVPAPSAAALEEVSAIAAAALKAQQIPGLSLVVMKRDDILLSRGYGLEDAARPEAVSDATIFALNSMNKQFVAAAVLDLAEEGRLNLDDAVTGHLPDFTHLPSGLTIRHLLSHTSGMRDMFVQPELRDLLGKDGTTFAEFLAVARHAPADFAPGSRWSYSNINYLMLGVVVERITGKPLETVLSKRLFEPLALHSMRLCPDQPGQVTGEARGHISRANGLVPHPPENVALFHGYCGSAVDMARWTRALASGKVVSLESYRQMTERPRLTDGRLADYGFAMAVVSPDGVQRYGHGGYGGGFSGQAAYYPEAELTVVVLTNRFVFPEYIERKISRRLLGLPEPMLREAELPAEKRQRYVGSYDIGVKGWYVQVTEGDGRLWFELSAPKMRMPLIYLGDGEFVSESDLDGYRLSFSKEEPAQELLLLGMGMMNWYGLRRP